MRPFPIINIWDIQYFIDLMMLIANVKDGCPVLLCTVQCLDIWLIKTYDF